jgi:hypothetical protein
MPDRCLTSIIFETGILFRVKMIFGEAFRIAIGLSFHWYAFRWYEYGVDDSISMPIFFVAWFLVAWPGN